MDEQCPDFRSARMVNELAIILRTKFRFGEDGVDGKKTYLFIGEISQY